MSLVPFTQLLPLRYRRDDVLDGRERVAADGHLADARDALNLALLCVEGGAAEEGELARQERAAQARSFLIEAVTAIARARVYIPRVRTYAVPVIMASCEGRSIEAELARLHQMATRLLWWNHRWLPARRLAEPLEPEDEAQLAVFVKDLARNARIDRALRYRWIGVAVILTAVLPSVGLYAAGLVAGMIAVVLSTWHLARDGKRPDAALVPP